jgi:predicted short-subunit dehydrogenase-like oxidoreductase (DUF2520 family)
MRELERRSPPPSAPPRALRHVSVVGAGRLGCLFAAGLGATPLRVDGPLQRGQSPDPAADAVLLCVPDAEIAAAAGAVAPGPLLGHCSGATGLEVLGARPAFSLHPLMTVAPGARPEILTGAAAAIDGSTPHALAVAADLATTLGLSPISIAPADRAAYHAAASIAANFLVTVEAAAERIGATAGLPRGALVPLVRAAVENWATTGPGPALTGPVARGDAATVAHQRAAIAHRTPDLLELFDALTVATRALATNATDAVAVTPC